MKYKVGDRLIHITKPEYTLTITEIQGTTYYFDTFLNSIPYCPEERRGLNYGIIEETTRLLTKLDKLL